MLERLSNPRHRGGVLKSVIIGLIGTVAAYVAAVAIKSIENPPKVGFDIVSTTFACLVLFVTWCIIKLYE